MKVHTTNYTNTLIKIAEDSPAHAGEMPPEKAGDKTIANIQFELLAKHPYQYTSDDVLFQVYAERNQISKSELKEARQQFFSKGQACMRCSPLTKRYGWGVHNNADGKIALVDSASPDYEKFLKDKSIEKVKAMKSKR